MVTGQTVNYTLKADTMPAHPLDNQIAHDPDGSIEVRFRNGCRFALKDDCICADLTSIKAVGIKHLDEVASHTINTIAGSRSHVLCFINGARLRYAYNSAGQLIELSADNLVCQLSPDNELLFCLPCATTLAA